jgi:GNAT superfamily N-acetyltransferase
MPFAMIKRTHGTDPDFISLISQLDHELWNELHEDQATYDPHNKVPDISTALVLYMDKEPVAIGCFREYDPETAEIKRMFVKKEQRGKGLSKKILDELEKWAKEKGFHYAILETSIHFDVAKNLYQSSGYTIIPNYGVYEGLAESVCMKKRLDSIQKNFTAI